MNFNDDDINDDDDDYNIFDDINNDEIFVLMRSYELSRNEIMKRNQYLELIKKIYNYTDHKIYSLSYSEFIIIYDYIQLLLLNDEPDHS